MRTITQGQREIRVAHQNLSISRTLGPEPFFIQHDPSPDEGQFYIQVDPGASVHIIERVENIHSLSYGTHFDIGNGAIVRYTLFVNNARDVTGFVQASIERDAHFECHSCITSSICSLNVQTTLEGQKAEASMRSLSYIPSCAAVEQNFSADHKAEETSSSFLSKGLVADGGAGSFHSFARIGKKAQKSVAKQYSHVLTLGISGKISQKPSFEIMTDDVSAAHGATVGVIDEEALFYLCARGLSKADARRHIVDGFSEEIIRLLPNREAEDMRRQCIDV